MKRWTAPLLILACLAAEVSAQAQEPPRSRSGILLFKMPADRQRHEEAAFTSLKPVEASAKTYDILIRPPAEAKAKATDTVEAHAKMLAQSVRVQPGSDPISHKHPAGFDVAVRGFYVALPDSRVLTTYVYAIQSGAKSAIIEFVASDPKILTDAVRPISSFIEGCRLAHAQVVAAGEPPLTEYDVEETTDFLQWLVDVPFTADHREVFRAEIVDGWKKKDQETIDSIAQVMKMRAELAQHSPEKQDVVRKQIEGQVLAELRKQPDRASKLLVQIYDSARKPIAEGEPALTRLQADAALELFYFMAGQLEGLQAKPTAADKDAWARHLAAGWPKLEPQVRKSFALMPLTWSATRAGWPEMTEADREALKKQYAQIDFIREMRSAFVKIKSDSGAGTDAAALQSKIQQNYKTTSSLLKTGFDSTMMQMAAMRNMTDTRYRWSYRPR